MRGEILAWIDRLLAAEAAVVIATHEIEPFVQKATRALAARGGMCRALHPLPTDLAEKMACLEALSRGAESSGRVQS